MLCNLTSAFPRSCICANQRPVVAALVPIPKGIGMAGGGRSSRAKKKDDGTNPFVSATSSGFKSARSVQREVRQSRPVRPCASAPCAAPLVTPSLRGFANSVDAVSAFCVSAFRNRKLEIGNRQSSPGLLGKIHLRRRLRCLADFEVLRRTHPGQRRIQPPQDATSERGRSDVWDGRLFPE